VEEKQHREVVLQSSVCAFAEDPVNLRDQEAGMAAQSIVTVTAEQDERPIRMAGEGENLHRVRVKE